VQSLTDLFILVILYAGGLILVFSLCLTLVSMVRSMLFFRGLPKLKNRDQFLENRDRWEYRNGHLAASFSDLLVDVPVGDGSLDKSLKRCGSAEEVFHERSLAHGIVGNRLFMAMPGLLTGLGVLGTFVGLALGIGGLDLRDEALEEFSKSIQPLISGSATAFKTSVWGVFASLVFAVLEKIFEAAARWPIRRLQHRLNGLVPRYLPEESMIDLQRSSIESEETLKGLAVAIGEQMQKALDQIGNSVTEAVRDALGGQAQDLGAMSANLISEALTAELENMKTAITEMAERFRTEFNGANSQLQETVSGFQGILENLSRTVQTTQGSVEQAVERLQGHEQVVGSLEDVVKRFDESAEKLTAMRDTFDLSSQRNAEAAEAQKSAAEENRNVAARFESIGEKMPDVSETIGEASRVIGSLGQPLLDLQDILQRTPDLFEEQAEKQAASEEQRATKLMNQTESLVNAVAEAAEKFAQVESLGESLSESAESLERAGSALTQFGEDVKTASAHQVTSTTASEKAASASERAAEKLSPIPELIANLAGELEAAGGSIRTGSEAARDVYKTLIDHQSIWFQGIETGLIVMKERLQELIDSYGERVEGQTQEHMDRWVEAVEESLQKFSVEVQALEGAANDLTAMISRNQS